MRAGMHGGDRDPEAQVDVVLGIPVLRMDVYRANSIGRRNTFMWRWADGSAAGMGSCSGGAAGDAFAGAASDGQARTPAAVLGGDCRGNAE